MDQLVVYLRIAKIISDAKNGGLVNVPEIAKELDMDECELRDCIKKNTLPHKNILSFCVNKNTLANWVYFGVKNANIESELSNSTERMRSTT